MDAKNIGKHLHAQLVELFPVCRSLTGEGTRQTLRYLKDLVPELNIIEVPSGSKAFDWTVPLEWNIQDAYILDEQSNRIIDFKKNNLHVVGYSTPINQVMTFEELEKNIFTLIDQPTAVPYITSYYSKNWGFCMSHQQLLELKKNPQKKYKIVIDSSLKEGNLSYGEIILKGNTKEEILLSTYVCHPSMANNELSGPIVTINLAQWLKGANRKYTYRILFLPETIGSIIYLSKHLTTLKKQVKAGFVLTCIGDDRTYSFLPSRQGETLADRIALHALKHLGKNFIKYSYLDRGSDERQYCSAGVDLPVCSVMRSKYGTYPEYHTSLDDCYLVSPDGLRGGYEIMQKILTLLEKNRVYQNTILCEPQLGRRGLYPAFSTKQSAAQVRDMKNLIAYADGKKDLVSIANEIGIDATSLFEMAQILTDVGILKEVS
jgi:aminopeptidase-like protein